MTCQFMVHKFDELQILFIDSKGKNKFHRNSLKNELRLEVEEKKQPLEIK